MTSDACGYRGRWAWVDLTERRVRLEPADPRVHALYVGGRGVQACLIAEAIRGRGPILDPLSPANRFVIGTAAANDTPMPTAGRGSCSFISPLTRAPHPAPGSPPHPPLYGLLTHASAGGAFPNLLKRAGFDQVIIDGRADRPVRLVVADDEVRILEAEDELFERHGSALSLRSTSEVTAQLTTRYPRSSTITVGPAGWHGVVYACLTGDRHRNFGRGGAGAVLASKNVVAITAYGRKQPRVHERAAFERLSEEIDALVQQRVSDPSRTASFRPETGTTWWLDRAHDGGFGGTAGGYLPWHNFDEGRVEGADYEPVCTGAFVEFSGRHHVCNRCRHVLCTRTAEVETGPYAGQGVRPEFESIALAVNCGVVDRDAIFHVNRLCNDLGLDTMTFGSVAAAAMELGELGLLRSLPFSPAFGDEGDLVRLLTLVARASDETGRIFGGTGDDVVNELAAAQAGSGAAAIAYCVTHNFGGLGYAGIQPKAFPGMFAAYATSSRGRGDHTHAWTVQAEEAGLSGPSALAACVASAQSGKALVDSLGLCDFFPEDVMSDAFLSWYRALTGLEYDAGRFETCGRRILALERHVNALQGRDRRYDAFVPPKLLVPLKTGPLAGRAVDASTHERVLDAYYAHQGWTPRGLVPVERLAALEIEPAGGTEKA